MTAVVAAGDVVAFWRDAGYAKWFQGGEAFDAECRDRLGEAHLAAARGKLDAWSDTAEGALALVLLLDQIPRNVYRGSAHAFATDPLALRHAAQAVEAGFDARVDPALRFFFYMPFEHSEQLADQDRAIELFSALGNADLLGYAKAHRDVIARFGRFPHRNRALGRESAPDEQAWLDAGGGF